MVNAASLKAYAAILRRIAATREKAGLGSFLARRRCHAGEVIGTFKIRCCSLPRWQVRSFWHEAAALACDGSGRRP
jgi:hypothetical protein